MLSFPALQAALAAHDWNTATAEASTVAIEGDITWVIIPLTDSRWAATNDAEVDSNRCLVYASKDEAIAAQWSGWLTTYPHYTETDRTERFGWVA